jgi:hypothetical protein
VFAYVVLNVPRPEGAAAKSLVDELRGWVADQLSPIAKPDDIRLTDNLPKTRSGKIMRRLLRSIARGEEITQDMSTLENPAILEQLRGESATAASETVKKPAKAQKTSAVKKAPRRKKAVAKAAPAKRKAAVKPKHGTVRKKALKGRAASKREAAAKQRGAAKARKARRKK